MAIPHGKMKKTLVVICPLTNKVETLEGWGKWRNEVTLVKDRKWKRERNMFYAPDGTAVQVLPPSLTDTQRGVLVRTWMVYSLHDNRALIAPGDQGGDEGAAKRFFEKKGWKKRKGQWIAPGTAS